MKIMKTRITGIKHRTQKKYTVRAGLLLGKRAACTKCELSVSATPTNPV